VDVEPFEAEAACSWEPPSDPWTSSTPSRPPTGAGRCDAAPAGSGRRSRADPFESLVTSITAQQGLALLALSIRNRLLERFGERGAVAIRFPGQAELARASEAELVALGFSRRKAEYVVLLARTDLDLGELAALPGRRGEGAAHGTARARASGPADWFSRATHRARPRAWPRATSRCRRRWLGSP